MAAGVDDQNHSLSQLLEGQLLTWFLSTEPQTGRISCGLLLCWFLTQGMVTQQQCTHETSDFFRQMEF